MFSRFLPKKEYFNFFQPKETEPPKPIDRPKQVQFYPDYPLNYKLHDAVRIVCEGWDWDVDLELRLNDAPFQDQFFSMGLAERYLGTTLDHSNPEHMKCVYLADKRNSWQGKNEEDAKQIIQLKLIEHQYISNDSAIALKNSTANKTKDASEISIKYAARASLQTTIAVHETKAEQRMLLNQIFPTLSCEKIGEDLYSAAYPNGGMPKEMADQLKKADLLTPAVIDRINEERFESLNKKMEQFRKEIEYYDAYFNSFKDITSSENETFRVDVNQKIELLKKEFDQHNLENTTLPVEKPDFETVVEQAGNTPPLENRNMHLDAQIAVKMMADISQVIFTYFNVKEQDVNLTRRQEEIELDYDNFCETFEIRNIPIQTFRGRDLAYIMNYFSQLDDFQVVERVHAMRMISEELMKSIRSVKDEFNQCVRYQGYAEGMKQKILFLNEETLTLFDKELHKIQKKKKKLEVFGACIGIVGAVASPFMPLVSPMAGATFGSVIGASSAGAGAGMSHQNTKANKTLDRRQQFNQQDMNNLEHLRQLQNQNSMWMQQIQETSQRNAEFLLYNSDALLPSVHRQGLVEQIEYENKLQKQFDTSIKQIETSQAAIKNELDILNPGASNTPDTIIEEMDKSNNLPHLIFMENLVNNQAFIDVLKKSYNPNPETRDNQTGTQNVYNYIISCAQNQGIDPASFNSLYIDFAKVCYNSFTHAKDNERNSKSMVHQDRTIEYKNSCNEWIAMQKVPSSPDSASAGKPSSINQAEKEQRIATLREQMVYNKYRKAFLQKDIDESIATAAGLEEKLKFAEQFKYLSDQLEQILLSVPNLDDETKERRIYFCKLMNEFAVQQGFHVRKQIYGALAPTLQTLSFFAYKYKDWNKDKSNIEWYNPINAITILPELLSIASSVEEANYNRELVQQYYQAILLVMKNEKVDLSTAVFTKLGFDIFLKYGALPSFAIAGAGLMVVKQIINLVSPPEPMLVTIAKMLGDVSKQLSLEYIKHIQQQKREIELQAELIKSHITKESTEIKELVECSYFNDFEMDVAKEINEINSIQQIANLQEKFNLALSDYWNGKKRLGEKPYQGKERPAKEAHFYTGSLFSPEVNRMSLIFLEALAKKAITLRVPLEEKENYEKLLSGLTQKIEETIELLLTTDQHLLEVQTTFKKLADKINFLNSAKQTKAIDVSNKVEPTDIVKWKSQVEKKCGSKKFAINEIVHENRFAVDEIESEGIGYTVSMPGLFSLRNRNTFTDRPLPQRLDPLLGSTLDFSIRSETSDRSNNSYILNPRSHIYKKISCTINFEQKNSSQRTKIVHDAALSCYHGSMYLFEELAYLQFGIRLKHEYFARALNVIKIDVNKIDGKITNYLIESSKVEKVSKNVFFHFILSVEPSKSDEIGTHWDISYLSHEDSLVTKEDINSIPDNRPDPVLYDAKFNELCTWYFGKISGQINSTELLISCKTAGGIPLIFPKVFLDSMEKDTQHELISLGLGMLIPATYDFRLNQQLKQYQLTIQFNLNYFDPTKAAHHCIDVLVADFDFDTVDAFRFIHTERTLFSKKIEDKVSEVNIQEFLLQAMYGGDFGLGLPGKGSYRIECGKIVAPNELQFPGLFNLFNDFPNTRKTYCSDKINSSPSTTLEPYKDTKGFLKMNSINEPLISTPIAPEVDALIQKTLREIRDTKEYKEYQKAYNCFLMLINSNFEGEIDFESLKIKILQHYNMIPPEYVRTINFFKQAQIVTSPQPLTNLVGFNHPSRIATLSSLQKQIKKHLKNGATNSSSFEPISQATRLKESLISLKPPSQKHKVPDIIARYFDALDVPGDGNCLFHAIAQGVVGYNHEQLRKMSGLESGWGTDKEIRILSHELKVPIVVYTPHDAKLLNDRLIPSYNAYNCGDIYNDPANAEKVFNNPKTIFLYNIIDRHFIPLKLKKNQQVIKV